MITDLVKIVEFTSNLGGKEPSPWTQARGSIHGCGSTLEAWTTPILRPLLTHARTGPNPAQIPEIQTLKSTQTHLLIEIELVDWK